MWRCARSIARVRITLRRSRLLRVATAVTVSWLILVVFYSVVFSDFRKLSEPNHFGDFLAGVFAPVAFFWLIVTVLMQSRELALQRRELALNRGALLLQAKELKSSVAAFKEQNSLIQEEMTAARKEVRNSELEREIQAFVRLIRRSGREIVVATPPGHRHPSEAYIFGDPAQWDGEFDHWDDAISLAARECRKFRERLDQDRLGGYSVFRCGEMIDRISALWAGLARGANEVGGEVSRRLETSEGYSFLHDLRHISVELKKRMP